MPDKKILQNATYPLDIASALIYISIQKQGDKT